MAVDFNVLSVQLTASGDGTLIAAPAAGNSLRIYRVEASNSHATTALTVGLKLPGKNSGSVFGKRYLPAVGGTAVWQFPGGELRGTAASALSGNLSALGQIEFTVYYLVETT